MKAVVCKEFGPVDTLVLEDLPDPVAGTGEVVIDVKAAGVNFPDGLMVRGEYQIKPPRPFTPGNEVSGIISQMAAGVTNRRIGERVVALCGLSGFAEKVAVAADRALPIPDDMDFNTAGGLMLVYGTSLHALRDKARLKAGETLLVLGAAGGVGLAAVEIGAAIGARVIAAASTDEKMELAKAHGATLTVNYASTDLKAELKRLVPGGIDVVYDPVGGVLTEAAVRGMGWGGRLLVVGFANGEIPRLALNLLLLKEAEAIGVFWGAWTQRDPAGHAANVAQLMQWFGEGKIRPHIGGAFPLAQAKDAIAAVMDRKAQGKIVITANDTPSH
jgi:NADPH2:quinone reductase